MMARVHPLIVSVLASSNTTGNSVREYNVVAVESAIAEAPNAVVSLNQVPGSETGEDCYAGTGCPRLGRG